MTVIAICLGLVIVFLALKVHEIKFIDQAKVFQQRNGSIHGGAVNVGILLFRDLQQRRCIEMLG